MAVTTTKIDRSGPAIRAALAEFAPTELEQFEAEFNEALARAAQDFDLTAAEAVLDRWWEIAVVRANPLTEKERGHLDRARDGDFRGLWEQDAAGNWTQL